ncbi:MAG: EVE domain-containing protein [Polyangiales bacterium]
MTEKAQWLMKSEPSTYSIDDLQNDRVEPWNGVRNYQARNFMRAMKKGELALFYHSNAKPPGVVGLCKIAKEAYPDPSQFDKKSPYFDPKSSREDPRWSLVDVEFVEKFDSPISLEVLKADRKLKNMLVVQKGSRLSVQPVDHADFQHVLHLANARTKLDSPSP